MLLQVFGAVHVDPDCTQRLRVRPWVRRRRWWPGRRWPRPRWPQCVLPTTAGAGRTMVPTFHGRAHLRAHLPVQLPVGDHHICRRSGHWGWRGVDWSRAGQGKRCQEEGQHICSRAKTSPGVSRGRGTTLVVRTVSMAPPKTKGGYLDRRFNLPFHKGMPSTTRAGSQMENTGAKRSVRNTLQAEYTF